MTSWNTSPPLAPVIPDAQQLRTVITRIIAKGYVFDSGAPYSYGKQKETH